MTKASPVDDRRSALRWECLGSWLEDGEWSKATATHIFLGLDPERTHFRSERDDGTYAWLGDSKPADAPGQPGAMNRYGFDLNMSQRYDRITEIVSQAPPSVRSPIQWIKWLVNLGIEPPWLRGAYGRPELRNLLPLHLIPRKDDHSQPLSAREAGRLGGQAKSQIKYGPLKRRVEPAIKSWIEGGRITPKAALARSIHDDLLSHSEKVVTVRTIESWITDFDKAMGAS